MSIASEAKTADGFTVECGKSYYGGDGRLWAIEAVGPECCYGREPGSKKRANRLRYEWLTVIEPDSFRGICADMLESEPIYLEGRKITVFPKESAYVAKCIDVYNRIGLLLEKYGVVQPFYVLPTYTHIEEGKCK